MPPPVPLSPAGVPLADFTMRLVAYLIDTAIMTAALTVLAIPAVIILTTQIADQPTSTNPMESFYQAILPLLLLEAGLFAVMLVIYYIYYVEIIRKTGQSVGKKLMKIRIVPLNPAETLTRGHLVKRYLVEFVGGVLIPLFSYLDGFWQLWDKPYQQALHDKFAKTVVVRVPV